MNKETAAKLAKVFKQAGFISHTRKPTLMNCEAAAFGAVLTDSTDWLVRINAFREVYNKPNAWKQIRAQM